MAQQGSAENRPSRLHRLIDGGWLEVVLASGLAILVLVLDSASRQPWQVFALDLAACAAAALTPRWPRAAGIALGMAMAALTLMPSEWRTMGEYAPLIPILGMGMRGAKRTRMIMTICYAPPLVVLAWMNAPSPPSAVAGWIVWAILIGVLWLMGSLYRAAVLAEQQSRTAQLLLQRQSLARELHDTVARSLTTVIMTAEQAALLGTASPADLERITVAAEDSMSELRLVMSLLTVPDPHLPISVQSTPLTEALESGAAQLKENGFDLTTTVNGDLSAISAKEAVTLGTAAQEAIANIVKHANRTSPCAIVVEVIGNTVELTFVNGYLAVAADRPDGNGMGLAGMHDRLRQAGGTVAVRNTTGQWITTIRLPLSTSPPPDEII